MFNDIVYFKTYVEKILVWMKSGYVFYKLPYWEQLMTTHLLYLIAYIQKCLIFFMEAHIIETSNTLGVRIDLIILKINIGQ